MIDTICKDIEKAINAGAYISALSLALTLPDWCGKAEYPSCGTSGRYKKWYHEYIGQYEVYKNDNNSDDSQKHETKLEKSEKDKVDNHPYLSADVVYSLRNQLLHQGNLSYENEKVKQEQNKVDRFILYFDTNKCEGGNSLIGYDSETKEAQRHFFTVNALNLIMKLELCATEYYRKNATKFDFMNIRIKIGGGKSAIF